MQLGHIFRDKLRVTGCFRSSIIVRPHLGDPTRGDQSPVSILHHGSIARSDPQPPLCFFSSINEVFGGSSLFKLSKVPVETTHFHNSSCQTMPSKSSPLMADRLAALHVWFTSKSIICCRHDVICGHRIIGCHGGGSMSVNHGYMMLAVFCSEKKEKKPLRPSLCITKRKLGAVCPSQRTRGNKVIRFGAAAFFLVAIERWGVLCPL